nr:HepT-like ribonuclease domain-containing protein [Cohnella sp. CFH 77786]
MACIPDIAQALTEAVSDWKGTLLQGLAQERALHLSVEIVTDVGSCLIDGFLMRDASSYEDIVDIIAGEGVVPSEVAEPLRTLVGLRKPLVQEYHQWPRDRLHPLTPELPDLLRRFQEYVSDYLRRELGK